jgi:D-alanyl-D-alanine carboxypeptidase (penicillin-binding protein 5/6)
MGAFLVASIIFASAIYGSMYMGRRVNAKGLRAAIEADTTARAMCTMEMSTGRVLYSKNQDARLPMASTTKIVTAITVLDNCTDLDTPIEINPRAVGIEGTSIYLQRGEMLTVRELLYGMMLRSGNDAAAALALHVRPTIEKFSDLMNDTARKVGARNSSFKNPHGLDQEGHYTTAYDLALISAYAMQNPTFAEIVGTKEIKVSGREYPRLVRNKNRLLHSTPDCVGVKTGFTKKAGRCYVGAFKDNAMTVICVVLNCGPMFEESATLMETANDEFTLRKILEQGQLIDCDCGCDTLCGVAVEDFYFPLRADENVETICAGDKVIIKFNGEQVYSGHYNRI